jgi:hypothetical protein
MNTFPWHLLLLLSVFTRAEFFELDGNVAYHDGLPVVAETEWIQEEKVLGDPDFHYSEHTDFYTTPNPSPFLVKPLCFHLQPLFYQEKLKLTDGYSFVFLSFRRSNIPHLNRDDEDPAFILG